MNRPRSRRFENRHNPSPSNQRTFTMSPRRPRKTKTWPENGCSFSTVCTCALRPSKPRRMSVTPAAVQNPGSCAEFNHLHRLSRIERNNAGSAPLSTLINALPGNSMWIVPAVACCCSAAGSPISASHGADTVTGSKAVVGAAGSANWPLLKARRHANTWLAFTPCARATTPHWRLAPSSTLQSDASPQPNAICECDVDPSA